MCAWASGHKQMCDICGVFNVFKKYLLICLFHKIRQGLIKIFNPGKNYSNKEMFTSGPMEAPSTGVLGLCVMFFLPSFFSLVPQYHLLLASE